VRCVGVVRSGRRAIILGGPSRVSSIRGWGEGGREGREEGGREGERLREGRHFSACK